MALVEEAQQKAKMTVWSTHPSPESDPPCALMEVRFAQMPQNAKATGSYLTVRTLAPPNVVKPVPTMVTVNVQALVDHPTGQVVLVLPYFMSERTMTTPEHALRVGTVLIAKEPLLQVSSSTPGTFILRCDSPSDVVPIWRDSPMWEKVGTMDGDKRSLLPEFCNGETVIAWKERGDRLVEEKRYSEAREAFAVALLKVVGDTEDAIQAELQLSLAEMYLNLGYYEKTIQHAQLVLDSSNAFLFQALLLTGRAHYELRQYHLAKTFFERYRDSLPPGTEDPQLVAEIQRCANRLAESKNGTKVFKVYPSKPNTYLDVADFTGPIQIANIPGKGRGMVASVDIQPGTQIMVNKAFQASFKNDNHRSLITDISHAITKNPKTFTDLVYNLTANSSEKDSRKRFSDPEQSEPIIDVDRLRGIIAANAFAVSQQEGGGEVDSGSGLFIAVSYFNHACVPNAMWMVYSDVIVVHAIKAVAEGEEVTIPYFNPTGLSRGERKKRIESYGFTCTCVLCALDDSEPISIWMERIRLLGEERSLAVMNQLEQTYASSQRTKLRLALYKPFLFEFDLQLKRGLLEEALEFLEKAIGCLGCSLGVLLDCGDRDDVAVLDRDALWCSEVSARLSDLICFYWSCETTPEATRQKEARRYLRLLELTQRVVYGNDRRIVKQEFDKIPNSLFAESATFRN